MRRILYISGTRADYGLMEDALISIHSHPNLSLGIIVTGMHLLPEYGETWREIEEAGLPIVAKVPVDLTASSNVKMASALGENIIAFSRILEDEKPDYLLLLGDRGEMLAGAIAAVHLNIPVVHIHGGERSGTIDESFRHAISKLAHYHLVATEESRNRLIRMGEKEDSIIVTGAPGLDAITQITVVEKQELFAKYTLSCSKPLLLVIFHPVVQQSIALSQQMNNLLLSVLELDMQVLVLMPNSDAGSDNITDVVDKFSKDEKIITAVHVPRNDFLSLVSYSEVLVGNSSCGIIEAASLATPVLNIGLRQNFRERNKNVIDSGVSRDEIKQGLQKALGLRGQSWRNVYGDGEASGNIVRFFDEVSINPAILEKVNAY